MPPTCWTILAVPFLYMKYKGGVQYADLSWVTSHEVQLDCRRSSEVVLKPKSVYVLAAGGKQREILLTAAAVNGVDVA